MSGVMLKTADLRPAAGEPRICCTCRCGGGVWSALALGLCTAFYGVMFAAVQTDMKRLLAWSSIENIGIVLAGVGLALTFHAYEMNLLAAFALAATLYHCLNHALFKSLLFLATGSVMHATRQRSLGKLGGLIRRMPWVAGLALVGTLAIAGLPPLNGFASEWMLLQAFLLTPGLPNSYLNMFVPVATAAVALVVALAGYVMVKFYGVVFLGSAARGQPQRGPRRRPAREARAGLAGVLVRGAGGDPGVRGRRPRSGRPDAGRRDAARNPRAVELGISDRDRARPRELWPDGLPAGDRRGRRCYVPAGAPRSTTAGSVARHRGTAASPA